MTDSQGSSIPRGRRAVDGGEIASSAGLVTAMLRARRPLARLMVAGALVGAVATIVQGRTYTSQAAFLPQTRRTPGNLSGVAAQFGVILPTDQGAQSPALYADLLTTRDILERVVDAEYQYSERSGKPVSGTLVLAFDARGDDVAHRRDDAVRTLTASMSTAAAAKTGIVSLAVRARSPTLAVAIVTRFLTELDRFNILTRQSQAAAERRFTEQRLREARAELRAAEDSLELFLRRNRIVGSPEQTFQRDRLRREVDARQQVQTTLAQAYEQAKIEEVRDTPLLTVVEQPELPVRPDSRHGIVNVIIGSLVGLLTGIGVAILLVSGAGGSGSGEREDLRRALRDAMSDLRRPWRLVAPGPR